MNHQAPVPEPDSADEYRLADPHAAYWACMPGWTAKEIAALSLGVRPELMQSILKEQVTCPRQLIDDLRDRRRLILRSIELNRLSPRKPKPKRAISWLKSNSFSVDEKIEGAVQRGRSVRDYEKAYRKIKSQKSDQSDYIIDHPGSARTLYTLIAMMMEKHYSDVAPHNITTRVLSHVEHAGMELTESTVRGALQAAREYLPNGSNGPDPKKRKLQK